MKLVLSQWISLFAAPVDNVVGVNAAVTALCSFFLLVAESVRRCQIVTFYCLLEGLLKIVDGVSVDVNWNSIASQSNRINRLNPVQLT